jgi:protein involved in polysaccharide export with SLBB domain
MYIKQILLSIVLIGMATMLAAQSEVSPEIQAQVRTEISKRGLDEQAVRARLLKNGIDVDKLSMEDLPAVQPKITKIIVEMEAEQKAKAVTPKPKPAEKVTVVTDRQTKAVQEKVEDGASVEEAVAEELLDERNAALPNSKIYGQALFRNKSLELYRATKDIIPPDSYMLSSGDIISINIFGASQADLQFEIEADGFIRPSGLPKIYLKGLSYGDAKVLLARRFAQGYLFKKGEFAVSLNTARTMTINIFGEVEQPGSYSISAINTAFNALIAAGGPTEIGSVRNIQLIRNGKSRSIDVFAFMQDPTVQYDFYLENNDILFVAPVERMISLSGAVIRPMRYELKKGEDLSVLLNYAGGLKSNAYTDLIQISRLENNEKVLIDLNLTDLIAEGKDFRLMDGDAVTIKTIEAPMQKVVSVTGPVRYPGEYALTEGMRISDLIRKGILEETARLDLAFLSRTDAETGQGEMIPFVLGDILENKAEDLELQKGDRLVIFTQARYLESYEVSITGSVRNAGSFGFDDTLRISDIVYLAGGITETALDFAYLIRTELDDPTQKEYIRVDLKEALANESSMYNLSLAPNDQIRILDRNTFTEGATVSISGAVRNPGGFEYQPSLKLTDLVRLSGGLSLTASPKRVEVFRILIDENNPTKTLMYSVDFSSTDYLSTNPGDEFDLQAFDQVVVRDLPDFRLQESVRLEGEIMYPGSYALLKADETLVDLINRAGGFTERAFLEAATLYRSDKNKGDITISLIEAMDNPASFDNVILKQGDVIRIPSLDQTVTIYLNGTKIQKYGQFEGASGGKIIVPYSGKHNAKWYIKEYANGFYGKSKRASVIVNYPNGYVAGTKSFLGLRSYPGVEMGSDIRMQKREKKEKKKKEKRESDVNINEIFATTIGAITTSLTLFLLIQQLNQ